MQEIRKILKLKYSKNLKLKPKHKPLSISGCICLDSSTEKRCSRSLKKNPISELRSNDSKNNSVRPLTTLSNHTHLQPTLNLTQPLVLRENDALRLARQIGHLPLVDLRVRRRPLLPRRDPIQELRPVQARHVLAARGGGQALLPRPAQVLPVVGEQQCAHAAARVAVVVLADLSDGAVVAVVGGLVVAADHVDISSRVAAKVLEVVEMAEAEMQRSVIG